jgi:hypothetical protein
MSKDTVLTPEEKTDNLLGTFFGEFKQIEEKHLSKIHGMKKSDDYFGVDNKEPIISHQNDRFGSVMV